ncbi:MAG TPA: type II toxin-antitoxin system VapB family antitoxin [Tepidisphaeraceae bacterium]|jgi:Arc/MetJ family transcription regulator|nr:type II toxin-antitoxin system VapB family antitoxin [Tepidisphaeraceae bacterium]
MKTSIDIPDKVLKEAMRHTKSSTKRDAVVKAMEEFNRRERMAALVKHLGTFEDFMTLEELMKMREMD